MTNEKVSCIITTYKRPVTTLERALTSIINQTYTNIEIIIINDFPKDKELVSEIEDMLKGKSDNRIKYVVHKKNQGACAARNTGIDHATGDYLAFLDDDDEWCHNKIESQLACFDEDDMGLVYCYFNRISKRNWAVALKDYSSNALTEILRDNFIGSTSFPLLKKEAVIKAGKFDADMPSSQDVDLWTRIIEDYKIKLCPEYLVNYYVSEEAISTNVNNIKTGYDRMLLKYKAYYNNDRHLHAAKLNYVATGLFINGGKKYSVGYWLRGIKVAPLSLSNFIFPKKILGHCKNVLFHR